MLFLIKKYFINTTLGFINYSNDNILSLLYISLEVLLNYNILIYMAIFYVITKKCLSYYITGLDKKNDMKDYLYNKYKSSFKMIFKIYNITMTLFSLYCFLETYDLIFNKLENYGYSVNNFDNIRFDRICYYFFISKYVEYIDTYFLILRNKNISYLQYIHHLGAPITTGLLYYTRINSTYCFVFVNSFIHTIMYLYYYLTLIGYKINFKYILTTLQIIQFNLGIFVGSSFLLLGI